MPVPVTRPPAQPRCSYKSKQVDSLWQRFHQRLTDPRTRRGQRHLLASILSLAAVAALAREKGPKGFARFATHLTQPPRRPLRCRRDRRTGQFAVPSEPTFRRLDRATPTNRAAKWFSA